jgi:HAD superfamily hydrolase (TIGR01549 family)
LTRDVSGKDSGGGTAIQTKPAAHLEAVIFDLDSTLCYYPLSVEEVFSEALRRTGISPEVLGDLSNAAARYAQLWAEVQVTLGSTDRIRLHIIEQLLLEHGSGRRDCAARLSEAYGMVRDESGVRPFVGVRALLSDLKRRYRLGLLTNGPSDIQWEKIRSLGFGDVFDAIVVAGDVGIYKPDVRIFKVLLDRLGVGASAALFVGDVYEMDIVGAYRVGMRTAMVCRDAPLPLGDVAPDIVISDVASLREVLL